LGAGARPVEPQEDEDEQQDEELPAAIVEVGKEFDGVHGLA
jgi:hypothetical protein